MSDMPPTGIRLAYLLPMVAILYLDFLFSWANEFGCRCKNNGHFFRVSISERLTGTRAPGPVPVTFAIQPSVKPGRRLQHLLKIF